MTLHRMPLSALLYRLEAFAEPHYDAKHRAWQPEDVALLVRLWGDRTVPAREIARRLERSFMATIMRAQLIGLGRRREGRLTHALEEIRRLYQVEGWTQARIADRFGVSGRAVSLFMHRHGIPVRPSCIRPNRAHPWRGQRRCVA